MPNLSPLEKLSLFFKNKLPNIFNNTSKYTTELNTNQNNNMIQPVVSIQCKDTKNSDDSNDSCGSTEIIDCVTPNDKTSTNKLSTHNNYYTDIDNILNDDADEYNCNNLPSFNTTNDMIILTVIDNLIDNIITNFYQKYDNKKMTLYFVDYYNTQLNYKSCCSIMTPYIYTDMCRYINGITYLDFIILDRLRLIKSYKGGISANNMYLGVFKTDNFIIKIDNILDSFTSDLCVMNFLGKGIIREHNIVLPYYVKLYSNNLKTNMNFSIQPRIHNSLTLHDWISIYNNKKIDISIYIKICISISKSILFLHSNHVVHGDIKPANILIENVTNKTYIIDFGLSGLHKLSEGTGGTKPFCCPDTANVFNDNEDKYVWTKNDKYYDLWSIAFIFATILIFRKCYNRYADYPSDFFDADKYVNSYYLHHISPRYRNAFISILCKDNDRLINLDNFIRQLEESNKE
jgi:hypothetical protein